VFTFLLVDIYLCLRNKVHLKTFTIVEKEKSYADKDFLVSMKNVIVFYKNVLIFSTCAFSYATLPIDDVHSPF
jgi:hypothetical protein